jgi:hypothetical protein
MIEKRKVCYAHAYIEGAAQYLAEQLKRRPDERMEGALEAYRTALRELEKLLAG